MADEFLDILGVTADSAGIVGAPVRLVRGWWRRNEGANMARVLQREIEARWSNAPTRSDIYQQLARHLEESELATPFSAAVQGDAKALEQVRVYLTHHLGTESEAASAEVAEVVVTVIASHIGQAQTNPQAATDAVGRFRHEQTAGRFDALGEQVRGGFDELRAAQEEFFDAIRKGHPAEPQESGLAQALILGPLRRVDAVDEVQHAERTAADGDPGAGAETLLAIAERMHEAGVGIAGESLRERAASLLTESGRHGDAAEVLLKVTRDRLDRGTNLAAFSIRALRETLPETEAWIADALDAFDDWTGDEIERARAITDAAGLADAAGRNDAMWFAARAIDYLAMYGQWQGVLALAEPLATTALADGDRLAVELDRLQAIEETDGADAVEHRWRVVLHWVDREGTPESAGIAWQRRGAALADREDIPGAHDAYRRAMDAWSGVALFEEQIADAFYSMQTSSIVNGHLDFPDAELRPLAYALRSSTESPAARIDQLLAEGMERRLAPNGSRQALAAFWRAYAIARRIGSLQQTLTSAERLAELYQHVELPLPAIGFYLAAGKGDIAAQIATTIEPADVANVLDTGGPRYYRAAVYAVVAAIGARMPENHAARLGPQVIAEARDEADGMIAPQPAIAAKRALAAVVLALPSDLRDTALDQLVAMLSDPRFDLVKQAAHALILATNAGVYDATDELLAVFARDPRNYGISIAWVAERLELEPAKTCIIRGAALAGQDPVLEALVMADLATDADVAARCEASAESWVALQPTEEAETDGRLEFSTGMVSFHGAGIVGRVASPATRAALLDHLLDVAADARHPEPTRSTAAGAIYSLTPALTAKQAAAAAQVLAPLAAGEYERSRWDVNHNHPLSAFRFTLHTPGELRAAALLALARLTDEHHLAVEELQAAVNAAVEQPETPVVAAAFDALDLVPELGSPVPLVAALRHREPSVRIGALRAFMTREHQVPPPPLLEALLADPVTEVRLALLQGSRGVSGADEVASAMTSDPDTYLRTIARSSERA